MSFRIWVLSAICFITATSSALAIDKDVDKALRERLKELIPEYGPTSIRKAPAGNWYEVAYGAQIVYMSPDARYIFQGNILDLEKKVDLTEQAQGFARKTALESVPEDSMFVFAPKDVDHVVTVFTDVDCRYCRKMHAEIDNYLKSGIKVRYLMFPRAGQGSASFDKAVSAWCADDRNTALTKAKNGEDIEDQNCKNPIAEQLALGAKLGVRGTPAVIMEDGELLMGYKSADELLALLSNLSKAHDGGKAASAAR